MTSEQEPTRDVEGAWTAFRIRLADRLAEMSGEDELVVEVQTGLTDDVLDGLPPHLWFRLVDEELLRAEVVANDHLDVRFWLGTDETVQLARSWEPPGDESDNWWQDVAVREVDRLAADCVTVLREVHGVLHPAFLVADGLERAADDPEPDAPRPLPVVEEGGTVFPRSHDELVALVDAALAELAEGELQHDGDGDVPFPVGLSVLFVRVVEDRPAVEVFAELVVDVARPERLPVELDILNRTHRLAKFYLSGSTTVRMSHELLAWPFSGEQLRLALRIMLDDVDTTAESLALRVEGKRFLEPPEIEEPTAQEPPVAGPAPVHPGMAALLELLHLGPVSSPAVAALFDDDRTAITRHCTGIRLGQVDCGEHDEEQVLTCLRRGLRHVVSGEIPERRRPLPPRRRTEQGSLIDDDEVGEDTLDLGWSA